MEDDTHKVHRMTCTACGRVEEIDGARTPPTEWMLRIESCPKGGRTRVDYVCAKWECMRDFSRRFKTGQHKVFGT